MNETIITPPPIGIIPERIWLEQRISALLEAMDRYATDGKVIPLEWVLELKRHLKSI